MARQRQSPMKFGRRSQRVRMKRNLTSPRPFIPLAKHKKGEVLQKPSLVRTNLQKALRNKSIATPLTDSDDSDGLVTKRKNAGRVANPIYASGAVVKGDTPGAHPSKKRKSMDDDENVASPGKRQETTQSSGLKRPSRPSLNASLATLGSSSVMSSSPADMAIFSPPVPVSSGDSILQSNLNNSILPAEMSIIGTLKPRKRQPSILRMIESNNSSHLTAEDENEFLPDDESTPLPVSRTSAAISTPGSSLRRPNKDMSSSSELKRPASSSKRERDTSDLDVFNLEPPSSSPATSRGTPQSSVPKQRSTALLEEDLVMAPPLSSSPMASLLGSENKFATTNKEKTQGARIVSTKAPQTQVPTPTKRPQRQRKKLGHEFDISEDSQGSQRQLDEPNGRSSHAPIKPQKKPGGKTGSSAPVRRRRGTSVLSDATNQSKNVRGATSRAKAAPAFKKGSTNSANQSGGARHSHTTSSARGRLDKENTPLPAGIVSDKLQAVRDKFAEIDAWDMEFEEVDVESGSSQAGYR